MADFSFCRLFHVAVPWEGFERKANMDRSNKEVKTHTLTHEGHIITHCFS